MKIITKFFLILVLLCIMTEPSEINAQASISVDHVDGLMLGKVQPDTPIKFHLRFTNNTGFNIDGQSIGFKIFLSNNGVLDSGTIEPPYFADLLPEVPPLFDLVFQIFEQKDGIGIDTIGIGGTRISNTGWPNGYDKIITNITTSVFPEHVGDSLCLDSTFYPPAGRWLWATTSGSVIPEWSGPHCYEILPSCCIGMRGNYNNSPDDQIDISDLVFLVEYMFHMGAAPVCDEEADINGDGSIDIADLVNLVAYMHLGGGPPAACP